MSKLQIYAVEEVYNIKLQKSIKRCVIQKEGLSFAFKNVTVWPELDIYEKIVPGFVVPEGYIIDEVDSTAVNPKSGKPYKNRTLIADGHAPTASNLPLDMAEVVKMVLNHEKRLFKLEQNADTIEYPENTDEEPFPDSE